MTPWGTTGSGEPVEALHLSAHGLRATILTYGAILQDVRLDGVPYSLTKGASQLTEYEGDMRYHGAIVGPVANRLKQGRATVAGKTYQLAVPQGDTHLLHGGDLGTYQKVWKIDDCTPSNVKLSLDIADYSDGLPGNRRIEAAFEIREGPILRLTVTTRTDAPTIANLTNHSYWNLDGSDTINGHRLQVMADQILEVDADTVPTGKLLEVAKTDFDLRAPRAFQAGSPPLDTNYCLAPNRRALTDCLTLTGKSGLSMTVATTEPGVHIYDGRPAYDSLAIEPQGWPGAANNPHFPSIEVTPDAPSFQVSEWRFKP